MKKFEEFKRVNQFDLPEIVDPERICVCFEIPNERYHIRAFWTALYKLTLWNTWATDEAHTGRLAAAVWREVWNTAIGDQTTMGCGCNDEFERRYRYSPTGVLQISDDNGLTWTDAPELDPRVNPVVTFPPSFTGDLDLDKCRAANSIAGMLQDHQAEQLRLLTIGASGVEFAQSVIALLVALGLITGGLTIALAVFTTAIAAFMAARNAAEFEAAFTETVWDNVVCTAYCLIGDDLAFTAEQWTEFKSQVQSDNPGIAGDWLNKTVDAMGQAGLTNAARSGYVGTRDCDLCGCDETWCYEIDFTATNGGFAGAGAWTLGNGWEATAGGTGVRVDVSLTLAVSPVITHIEMDVEFINRGNVAATLGGVAMLNFENVLTGTYEWDGSISGSTALRLFPTSGAVQGNQCTMTRILVRGTGTNPFGTDNCT